MKKEFSWNNVIVVGAKKKVVRVDVKPLGINWDKGIRWGMDKETAGVLFIEGEQHKEGII